MIYVNNKSYRASKNKLVKLTLIAFLLGITYLALNKEGKFNIPEIIGYGDQRIESIVDNYLQSHPEKILSAVKKAQDNKNLANNILNMVDDKKFEIIGGNPNGSVEVIYYFDYNCSHCHTANNVLERLISENPDLKIIYREMPILGEHSRDLAAKSIAIYLIDPSKYKDFHNILMGDKNIQEPELKKALIDLNIDEKLLKETSSSIKVQNILNTHIESAMKNGIRGTPSFIINNEIINDTEILSSKIKDSVEKR